jgi:serine/threonine protein kinase
VAAYGLQLLSVLEAAHALGVVHRDIKPGNIMIAAGDQVKLTYFGIAHTVWDPRLTRTGVLGTQAYLAPERSSRPRSPRRPTYGPWGRRCFTRPGAGARLSETQPARRCARS